MPENKNEFGLFIKFALIFFIVSLLVVGCWTAFTSIVKADVAPPKEVIKTGVTQAKSIIDNPDLKNEEKRSFLHNLLLPLFDFEKMTRMILGSNFKKYGKRSAELTPLLIELIENSYLKLSAIDSAKGIKILYGQQTIDGEYAVVETKIITKNDTQIPISYRLILSDGAWKVYDVIIEGVSMVGNYRSQFNAVLNQGASGNRDPFDFLLDKIREKIAQAKSRQ